MERIEQRLLRDALIKTGTSQSEVAQIAGISRPNVCAYLSGVRRPTVISLNRLLSAMNVDAQITLSRVHGETVRSTLLSELALTADRSSVIDDLHAPMLVFGLQVNARLV